MLLIATSVFGLSFSANAQLMAQTREFADAQLPANQATLFNSIVRACIAVAWIAGPPLGFILLSQLGFKLQCTIVGSAYFATALLCLFVLPKTGKVHNPTPAKPHGNRWAAHSPAASSPLASCLAATPATKSPCP